MITSYHQAESDGGKVEKIERKTARSASQFALGSSSQEISLDMIKNEVISQISFMMKTCQKLCNHINFYLILREREREGERYHI